MTIACITGFGGASLTGAPLHLLRQALLGEAAAIKPHAAAMCASLAPLSIKAADGFIVQPAVLQAAMLEIGSHGTPQASGPAAADAVCLPTAATAASAAAWGARGAFATLVTPIGSGQAAAIEGICFQSPQSLEPSLADAAQVLDAADTLYTVEWQAADSQLAVPQPQSALVSAPMRCKRLAALGLSQAASLAVAHAVQLLHSHRSTALKNLALHAAGALPVQQQLAAAAPAAVGALAVAGVLKNLPYEMPFLSSQLLDTDPADPRSCGTGYACQPPRCPTACVPTCTAWRHVAEPCIAPCWATARQRRQGARTTTCQQCCATAPMPSLAAWAAWGC